MKKKTVLAIDLGASSGRVMAVGFDGRSLSVEELNRFPNTTVTINGTLTWDFLRLWGDIQTGIGRGMDHKPAGLGVDTWGVDFGLLDRRGDLLGNPIHYRDSRTDGMMALAFERVGKERIYAQTGIQFMDLNTIYQLMSLVENDSPQLAVAETLLTSPDLLNYWLTGAKVSERTIASTTQLLNPLTGGWATDLMDDLGIPSHIFPAIVDPGARVGAFQGVPVFATASHDTASAVAAVPMTTPNAAYLSSGTWSLAGLEMDRPILTPEALAANVTNEAGAFGTITLLRNTTGMWIVQQCRETLGQGGPILLLRRPHHPGRPSPGPGLDHRPQRPHLHPPRRPPHPHPGLLPQHRSAGPRKRGRGGAGRAARAGPGLSGHLGLSGRPHRAHPGRPAHRGRRQPERPAQPDGRGRHRPARPGRAGGGHRAGQRPDPTHRPGRDRRPGPSPPNRRRHGRHPPL